MHSRIGFRFSSGTLLLLMLPAALGSGWLGCGFVLVVIGYAVAGTGNLLTPAERAAVWRLLPERNGG